jgi:hypothetical protein
MQKAVIHSLGGLALSTTFPQGEIFSKARPHTASERCSFADMPSNKNSFLYRYE